MLKSPGVLAMHDDHAIDAFSSRKALALPEMLDAILSHLHLPLKWDMYSDRAALRACTLVNRRWLDAARSHLWSALSFAIITPGAVDEEKKPLKPSSLESLHEFLTSSPAIRQTVRSLTLVGHYGSRNDILDATTLYSIFCILPALQHLVLDAICPRLVNPPHDQPRLSVRSIEICGGERDYEGSPAHMLRLTDMFSDIRELIFGDYWLVDLYTTEPSVHQPVTRVTRIEFISAHDMMELLGVLRHFDSEVLTSVPLGFSGSDPDTTIHEAILAVGSSRTEISIRLNDQFESAGAELDYVTILSACRCLRRIHFIFDYWYVNDGYDRSAGHRAGWERLMLYISHIPDTVKTVLIDFSCGPGCAVIADSEALLITEGLSRVGDLRAKIEVAVVSRQRNTRVFLVPGGKPTFSLSEQAQLRTYFPRLSAAGLLYF